MEKLIKILVLTNNQILISQIEEVTSELGEPDCRLTKPFELNERVTRYCLHDGWLSIL